MIQVEIGQLVVEIPGVCDLEGNGCLVEPEIVTEVLAFGNDQLEGASGAVVVSEPQARQAIPTVLLEALEAVLVATSHEPPIGEIEANGRVGLVAAQYVIVPVVAVVVDARAELLCSRLLVLGTSEPTIHFPLGGSGSPIRAVFYASPVEPITRDGRLVGA